MLSNNYFEEDEFTMLNDLEPDTSKPTRQNILNEFDNLINFANANLEKEVLLFLSYSGHGSYLKDYNGDEADGMDEVLCPLDYDTNGFISDDEIKSNLIDIMPNNVRLFVLIDACHSGTMCDLKYNYMTGGSDQSKIQENITESKCNVVMISGSKDSQTSADAYVYDPTENKNEYQGAMSASFIANFHDDISHKDLLTGMREWLVNNNFDQIPQLSSGKFIDIDKPFLLTGIDDYE
jgi:hypothetical protein